MAIAEFDPLRRDFLFAGRRNNGKTPRTPRFGSSLPQPEPPDWKKLVTRRKVIIGAGTIAAGTVAAFLKPWEWLAEKPEEQLQKVQQEVIRLARLQPPDSLINTVYRGDISTFNPIFKSKTRSGFTNEEYAQIGFINASYSPDQRFRFTSLINQSTATYATLDKLDVAIYFSPFWLNSTDQVKLLAMEKEAINLALWNSFCQIALNTYRNQGRIDLIDPRVTERELANTMGRQLIIENPLMQKLYDYAGYLAVMPKVGQLLQLQDPQINKDLFEHSNFGTIYQMAQRSKIEVNLEFGSREFLTTAFNENGPWGKMIADPSVGAPPIPVPPRR